MRRQKGKYMPGKGKKGVKNKKSKPDLDSPKKRYANAGNRKENGGLKLTETELDNGFVMFDSDEDLYDPNDPGRSTIFAYAGGAGPEGFGEGGLDELLAPQEEKTDDPWAKKENWEEYVTEKPEPGSFLKKERYEKEYIEPFKKLLTMFFHPVQFKATE